ncbi:MAG: hypothetical protein AB8U25_01495 [Rickettsiales endosymbiont of Dermacentor nuttalli]
MLGNEEQAISFYKQSLGNCNNNIELIDSINQDYSEAVNQIGHILYQENKYCEAEELYNTVLEIAKTLFL